MGQATDTKNHGPHHQVVDVPAFDDEGGIKRTASGGSFQEPDAVHQAPPPAPAHHGANSSAELEAQPQPVGPPAIPSDPEAQHDRKTDGDHDQEKLDSVLKIIGFFLPPAVGIAVLFAQTAKPHELPRDFQFLSLAMALSFNFIILGKNIAIEYPKLAKLFERVGVLSAVTALSIAATIPLPAWLKFMICTVSIVNCIAMVF